MEVHHTFWEGNMCADFLAGLAKESAFGEHDLDRPSRALGELLLQDAMGAVFVRNCLM